MPRFVFAFALAAASTSFAGCSLIVDFDEPVDIAVPDFGGAGGDAGAGGAGGEGGIAGEGGGAGAPDPSATPSPFDEP